MVHRRRRRPYSPSRRTFPTPITRAPLTSRRTGTCLHLSMFAAAKELPSHLATIVPVAAAHPPLALAIAINNVGETYDVQWLTLTSGRAGQQNLSGDQKFWRSKFLDEIGRASCRERVWKGAV